MAYSNTRHSNFSAEIEAWVKESQQKMQAVVRGSINDAVDMAQMPKARGGHMPVDTGFLRSSGRGSLNGWPNGPSEKPDDAKPGQFQWDGEAVTTVLAAMEPGETFYFGWTAVYALRQEVYNGFLETTQQKWQQIVDVNVGKLSNG